MIHTKNDLKHDVTALRNSVDTLQDNIKVVAKEELSITEDLHSLQVKMLGFEEF